MEYVCIMPDHDAMSRPAQGHGRARAQPGRVFFFRGTHKVRDDLQLSHFVC